MLFSLLLRINLYLMSVIHFPNFIFFPHVPSGAFHAFDKDGDGIIKLNVLEVTTFVLMCFFKVFLYGSVVSLSKDRIYITFCAASHIAFPLYKYE